MSKQYDFKAGFDPSSVNTITQTQLLQMVQRMEPLSNIGGIIYSATAPDVANNPRFIRYIWMDSSTTPPIPKYYDGANWQSRDIADGSIVNSMLAARSVGVENLSRTGDKSADASKAKYILRVDAAGQYIEIASLSTVLGDGLVPLVSLNRSGINVGDNILNWNGNELTWKSPSATTAQLDPSGSANQVLAMNAAGSAVNFRSLYDILTALTAGGNFIPITAIDKGAASSYQVLRISAGGNIEWGTAPLSQTATIVGNPLADVTAGVITIGNPLAAIPKNVYAVLRIETTVAGYVAGEEIPLWALQSFKTNSYNSGASWLNYSFDAGNVYLTKGDFNTGIYIWNKTTGVQEEVTLDIGSFRPVFYISI